jgi:hypothetical protein
LVSLKSTSHFSNWKEEKGFSFKDRKEDIWNITHDLRHALNLPSGSESDFIKSLNNPTSASLPKHLLLTQTGLRESESHGSALYGSLDGLNASNINKGAFKLAFTRDPKSHLTFTKIEGRATLQILDLDSIFALYPLQRLGFMRYIPTL